MTFKDLKTITEGKSNLKMNKILITGGAGYLGSHTALTLLRAGYHVVLFDNLSTSDMRSVSSINKIFEKKVNFIQGDIRNLQFLSKKMKEFEIDSVIHFAGFKSVSESIIDPLEYYDNNVSGSICLLQAMKQNGIKKIVFSSSATVYGNPSYLPYDEDHPTEPINPYGRTKLIVEKILKDVADANQDWSIVSLRYFNPIGADESGSIGEFSRFKTENLIPLLIKVANGEIKNLKIFGGDYQTSDGSPERDFIHVIDIAKGHLEAINFLDDFKGFQAINLGTGVATSVLHLVKIFEKVNKIKIPIKIENKRPGDLPSYYANPSKALKLLHWKTENSIESMCESAWRFDCKSNKLGI